MPQTFPSIQSFFPLTPSPRRQGTLPNSIVDGDAFTKEEVEAVTHPSMYDWLPERDYEEVDIATLIPGPQCITITGRVANVYTQHNNSKMPQAAKGCLKVIVKDDTGALTVRLWFANLDYNLQLGQLVSLWTNHVSSGENRALSSNTAPLFISMFPERDRTCHLMVHDQSDNGVLAKTPLGYNSQNSLPGLMTLENFQKGGHEVFEARILVCVKSIRAKKKVTTKAGGASELVNVHLFDDTSEAILTLWGPTLASAERWSPSKTILLISHPGCRIDNRGINISLNSSSHVDVNPAMKDAEWLRKLAQRLLKKDNVNPELPLGPFDIEAALHGPMRALYTLADVDEFVRAAPTETFTGYLSLLILEVSITTLHMRKMLFCTECCGVPLYANTPTATCRQCDRLNSLRVNPRALGKLVDETGTLQCGKLIWSEKAWDQLLGRTKEELADASGEVLRYLERRLVCLRVTIVFGVAGAEGVGAQEVVEARICVLGVLM